MLLVSKKAIEERAASLPVGYLKECEAVADTQTHEGYWRFELKDYFRIKKKYARYTKTEAHAHEEGQPISGCCDRADQY